MRPIPKPLLKRILADPRNKSCAIPGCGSVQVELDHVWKYAGKQINEHWAIIALCYDHHRGGSLNRPLTQWLSLGRATEADLMRYPKTDWKRLQSHLTALYGMGGSQRQPNR